MRWVCGYERKAIQVKGRAYAKAWREESLAQVGKRLGVSEETGCEKMLDR